MNRAYYIVSLNGLVPELITMISLADEVQKNLLIGEIQITLLNVDFLGAPACSWASLSRISIRSSL